MIEQEEKSAKIYNFWDRISYKLIFISRRFFKEIEPNILRQEMSAPHSITRNMFRNDKHAYASI